MNIGVWIPLAILCMIRVSECIECYTCQNIADPNECRNTSQCSSGQQSCSLHIFQTDSELRYTMGCQNNQLCSSLALSPHSIIGRSVQTRQQYTCHECCSTDRCNENLCFHKKPSECTDDETLDCARLNTLFNVCADVHHAKVTCPKFCGLCQLVDGNWAEWGTWTQCSVTCANGTQERSRTCSNPPPSNGGLNCSGPAVDTKLCTKQLCPVHGNWADWSSWSSCSVTCDVGLMKKTRTCTNPTPDRFGDNCYGDASEYTVCKIDHCIAPVHGNWSTWSVWSTCSVTCDGGLQKRSRTCTNPKPNALGDYCFGDNSEYTVCQNQPCVSPVHGNWSTWSVWSTCSVTCDGGLQKRSRTCTNPKPNALGDYCFGDNSEYTVCQNQPCVSPGHVAAFNAHRLNVLSNLVCAFPIVIFNEGNAYNPSTGHFTAPVDGIYYFTAHICVKPGQDVYFFLEKGSENMIVKVRLTATDQQVSSTSYSCASASCAVKLTRNEHVWVMMHQQYTTSQIFETDVQT
ncbi:coadhesin-like isoform X4 [Dreissena polymorpha]|nr:coadhesin-like isoform X2 [Dreissena polymorpha]XP_052237031.1 coadhesin-like isoform X3 [Dreissena polymorpha]XP_052237032.1 coadhesin-like isoform X4 [Dreissena polymorpha]